MASSVKTFFNKNSVIRIGPMTPGSPFRVSMGAAPKYWNQFSTLRKWVQPIHTHIERGKFGIDFHPAKWSWYKKW